ncbi:hypothetical protein Hypma_007018 [Hypsizygus marmoreus]|uniref:Uncharacterized protein n=1 Tax=Hypsizygus marmoreus TaxID=39966 RepID=A0A369K9Y0_HYPMA|nr:hypothetical protein Hypma_007018 [Hypsizygus marmoreus]
MPAHDEPRPPPTTLHSHVARNNVYIFLGGRPTPYLPSSSNSFIFSILTAHLNARLDLFWAFAHLVFAGPHFRSSSASLIFPDLPSHRDLRQSDPATTASPSPTTWHDRCPQSRRCKAIGDDEVSSK